MKILMPYSKFTLSKAVEDFQLTIVEGDRFLPEVSPVHPTALLKDILKETVPWAIAVSSEKARSEGIINPVLLEVKRQLNGQISVFSGEESIARVELCEWKLCKLRRNTPSRRPASQDALPGRLYYSGE
jgi:hypothetical protein